VSTIAVPFALHTRLARTEVVKRPRLMWRRRSMLVVATTTYGLNYLGISLFIGGGHLVADLMVRTVPALLAVVRIPAVICGICSVNEPRRHVVPRQTQRRLSHWTRTWPPPWCKSWGGS
jgi:hypothetical protein